MKKHKHVYVAMSGGVDSTVAAVRLCAEGYRVTGIYMDTWKDPKLLDRLQGVPAADSAAAMAAESIGVPLLSVDVRDLFFKRVVQRFIREYLAGKTPNPCLLCNPQVKWGILGAYAFDQGADFFATGHYARIHHGTNGKVQLMRGLDRTKDQSYVLSMLSQAQLRRSLLPLGELTKEDVRKQAQAMKLPVADSQESQDLCFLGSVDYRDFLKRYAPESAAPGEIVNLEGDIVGTHHGLAYYTVGQRRGIRIAAPQPYFVVDKDMQNNRLIVSFAEQAGKSHLSAVDPNWIAGEPPAVSEEYDVMIRYRSKPIGATLISVSEDEFRIKFSQYLRGITPGQVVVLYQGEVCLGGGIIQNTW